MNTTTNFLPIFLLVAALVALFIIPYLMSGRIKKYVKNVKWMVTGYMIVLLVSVGVFFLLPIENGATNQDSMNADDIPDPHQFLYNGTIDEIDQTYVSEEWNFNYEEEDQLNINFSEDNGNGSSTFVEKTDELDGEIKATFYQTPTFVQGMDISEEIPSPRIDLSSNVLAISETGERIEMDFSTFNSEFPFRQFSGETIMGDIFVGGRQLLFIRVPETDHLDLDSEIKYAP